MPNLPPNLCGPVTVALARSEETVPAASSMPGGSMYELKWDGYRAVVVRDDARARLWSRQGKDLTGHFPDLAAACEEQLDPGTVVDGEAVIWNGARLDFDLLQRRLVNGPRKVAAWAAKDPATLMVFDVLALGGADMRRRPLHGRRVVLEELAAGWVPPLQLSPVTTDEATARAWFTDYRPAGIEGLVVKGADSVYAPGRRIWVKVKSRESTEVLVGAVTGLLRRPDTVVAGLVRDGVLQIVGRTTPLSKDQSQALGAVLAPAAPGHPWPEEVGASRFGSSRDTVSLTKVDPVVVAEVLADSALQGGRYRHPLRFVRVRSDLAPGDLP